MGPQSAELATSVVAKDVRGNPEQPRPCSRLIRVEAVPGPERDRERLDGKVLT